MTVLGVGGVFVKSSNPKLTHQWYQDVLGLSLNAYGGFDFSHKAAADGFGDSARTVFARFEAGSDYFAPSEQPFMINLIVQDLDALLTRIEAAGVDLVGEPEQYDYGRFAWILDPDGVKIELWEPVSDISEP